jgi:hypothetical protein
MKPPEPPNRQELIGTLLKSGFPLQTAVAELVKQLPEWRVERSEFPWYDSALEDQYVDLIAAKDKLRLAIECKKTDKDSFIFLTPGKPAPTDRVHFLRAWPGIGKIRTDIDNEILAFEPRSPESEYCVVSTSQTSNEKRVLERTCRLTVRATDSYMKTPPYFSTQGSTWPVDTIFIPVLVTNAPLYVADYVTASVSFTTGGIDPRRCEFKQSQLVRFCKSFTSERGRDIGSRTVFVVNSSYLGEFLARLALIPNTERKCLGHLV